MSPAAPERRAVESWLREWGLRPGRAQRREGVVSWDLRCDGRRRVGLPVTVILAPGLGGVVWIPFAPPISDGFRKGYRRLLRWNEEYPFVKFGLTEDERPVISAEVPVADLGPDQLGEALARCIAVCDALADEIRDWLAASRPAPRSSISAVGLLERYAERLGELVAPA